YNDQEMMEIALVENIQRENLNPLEEARAYQEIINSTGMTQETLADKFGKSRPHITNMLGLLRLPEPVQQLVLKNELSMGHARVLSKLS
ncbi:ParB/RepB/Spo0J family partition protein, partial [Vibrio parahaemolyticus]|nr:ParB/RepB/Spo0J family partition protein [Vibrio parahaemolyticus]